MAEEEYMIPKNRRYIERWAGFILMNRRRGKDYEVLNDFLKLKSEMFGDRKNISNGDYDVLFDEVEKRVKERLNTFESFVQSTLESKVDFVNEEHSG
ncbi:MAG: hypothetical protein AABX83_00075 [Nanoarchaeota archaeon]